MGTTSSHPQQTKLQMVLQSSAETLVPLSRALGASAKGEAGLHKEFLNFAASEQQGGDQSPTSSPLLSVSTFFEAFVGHRLPLGDDVLNRFLCVLGGCTVNKKEGLQISFPVFARAVYVFTKATPEEKYRLIFAMFDVGGGGALTTKDFQQTSLLLIRGEALDDVEHSGKSVHSIRDMDSQGDMKYLTACLVSAAFATYDTNGDGKLTFEEWLPFARDDAGIQRFLLSLSSSIRAL